MDIVVALKDLDTGGIQRSCINFVNLLAGKGINVDLLLMNDDSPLIEELDKSINIIRTNKALFPFAVLQKNAKKYGLPFFVKRTIKACIAKVFGCNKIFQNALNKQKCLEKNYDIAISFQPSMGKKSMMRGCSELILQKVTAKQKFAFMHSDFGRSGLNEPYAISIFEQFDKIVCVSKSCAEQMKQLLPNISSKIDYLYNVINTEEIITKAKEETSFNWGEGMRLVTVARLSEEKGHIRLLEQLQKLHKEGFTFQYAIAGDGKEYGKIKDYICSNGMESYVKLLGNKFNPYPYIKQSNLFVLPSFHESYGIVLIESMVLGVPVLTTNTISADEVVGDYGFVCENSNEGLYSKLKEIMSDKTYLENARDSLKEYKYSIKGIIDKFNKFAKGIEKQETNYFNG